MKYRLQSKQGYYYWTGYCLSNNIESAKLYNRFNPFRHLEKLMVEAKFGEMLEWKRTLPLATKMSVNMKNKA